MQFQRKQLSNQELLSIYKALVLPRLIEEKMLVLLRQGKISKWFSGIGQEAISVGTTLALEEDEWVMPLHRNLGVFTTRKMPLEKLFKQDGRESSIIHYHEKRYPPRIQRSCISRFIS